MKQATSKFYNPERKEKFIGHYLNQNENVETNYLKKSQCNSSFSKARDAEQKFEKDLCEFDDDENKYFIANYLTLIKDSTSRVYVMVYKAYLKWCAQQGYITEDNLNNNYLFNYNRRKLKEINSEKDKSSGNKLNANRVFGSEESFVSFVDKIFSDDEHIMDAAVICLLYCGFDADEIVQIKITDVDKDKQEISGKKIDNNHAFEIICRAIPDTVFVSTAANGKQIYKTYIRNQYLIRRLMKSENSMAIKINEPMSISYVNSIFYFVKKRIENSEYKNFDISIGKVSKLKFFFEMLDVYNEKGENYLINHYQEYLEKYGNNKKKTLTLNEFLIMKNLIQ